MWNCLCCLEANLLSPICPPSVISRIETLKTLVRSEENESRIQYKKKAKANLFKTKERTLRKSKLSFHFHNISWGRLLCRDMTVGCHAQLPDRRIYTKFRISNCCCCCWGALSLRAKSVYLICKRIEWLVYDTFFALSQIRGKKTELLVLLFAARACSPADQENYDRWSLSCRPREQPGCVECVLLLLSNPHNKQMAKHMCFNRPSRTVDSMPGSFWSNKEAWSWLELELITNLFVSCLTRHESRAHPNDWMGRRRSRWEIKINYSIHCCCSVPNVLTTTTSHVWKLIALSGWYFSHSQTWSCWFLSWPEQPRSPNEKESETSRRDCLGIDFNWRRTILHNSKSFRAHRGWHFTALLHCLLWD